MKLLLGFLVAIPVVLTLLALYIGEFLWTVAALIAFGIALIVAAGVGWRPLTKTTCPHCNVAVSTEDATCKHCGKPI